MQPEESNPYASPSLLDADADAATDVGVRTIDDFLLLKDFRTLCFALSIVWIVYALYCACVAFLILSREPKETPPIAINYDNLEGIIGGALAFCWAVASFGTYLKHIWIVYFGLFVSYGVMIGMATINVCSIWLMAIPVVLAHLVIHKHHKLVKFGIRSIAWS